MKDTRNERITQLYEDALLTMRRYSSCKEYLSAEPELHKPITLSCLSSFIRGLQYQINKYDCCIDDIERAKVGIDIINWCRSIAQHDCIAKEEEE